MKSIDQKYLKECLTYNPESGLFTWNRRPSNHFKLDRTYKMWNTKYAGTIAGSKRKDRRISIDIDSTCFMAHRLALIYTDGDCDHVVDHINRNPSDNRRKNLRRATMMQNAHNRKIPRINTSGVKGVSIHKGTGKFIASITSDKKRFHLGLFSNIKDAEDAVSLKRAELHGEFACSKER